jgi:hypothetical protein
MALASCTTAKLAHDTNRRAARARPAPTVGPQPAEDEDRCDRCDIDCTLLCVDPHHTWWHNYTKFNATDGYTIDLADTQHTWWYNTTTEFNTADEFPRSINILTCRDRMAYSKCCSELQVQISPSE